VTVGGAAIAILAFVFGAPAFASQDDSTASGGTRPVVVKVATVQVVHAGNAKDDPRATFGVVNLETETCYAIAAPMGASVAVGENYALVAATDIDDEIAKKMHTDYPKCAIVEAVARVMR
jgi:hypothetical protein